MVRWLVQLSTMVALAGALTVVLAMGAGQTSPPGEEIVFNSASTWQAADVNIYVLDLTYNLVQPMFKGRADNLPGLPLIWSPDGQRLAFVGDSESFQTYIVELPNMRPRHLSVSLNKVFNAVWSPDGRWLAFAGTTDESADVYLARADGSEVRNLTQTGQGYKYLAWSPDSRWIAAESLYRNEDIYLIDATSGDVTNLTDNPDKDIRPLWSPNGQELAFLSSRANKGTAGTRFDLYTLALGCVEQKGSCPQSARRLTHDHPADSMWLAKWAPDNRRLLFGSTSTEGGSDIFLVDNQSAETRNLTHNADPDSSPEWSPDGSQFVFETRQGKNWTIYLMDTETLESRQLTDGQHDNRSPIWSPDGSSILFTANPQRNWDLYRLNLTTASVPQRLTRGWTIEYAPLWRPSG